MGWIGVDLDGVLAEYHGWQDGAIGAPVPAMVERVQRWLAEGRDVRIFTARVCVLDAVSHESGHRADPAFAAQQTALIQDWCEQHLGRRLPVTAVKDFQLVELWDDRCVQVQPNRGVSVAEHLQAENDQLHGENAHLRGKLNHIRALAHHMPAWVEQRVLAIIANAQPDTEAHP